ncbi:hypothetical protein FSP39_019161 [Pinctada imbricata]|uniref:F-box domain-containing protein n=1 Tax=Pinctada imbricata TaxID=66713 RepID=A0AA89C7S8_PINIB|nr:hypothetical protein FSP39_019161 [Pinctada imbricata]
MSLATLNKEQRETKRRPVTSTRHLTGNDNKVLGRNTQRKQDVVAEMDKYTTLKMKTHNSAWTPVVHKPSNEQIFKERRDLVSHWFDLWTDSQRRRFLDVLFQQCNRPTYKFVQTWFQDNVPLQHLDFTTVLPKFLSMYIFSFLDPKSLCKCAQVSWHWKFLSEQDDVWMPKCLKYGWFLPYKAPDNEYGAWKKYFLGCVQTPDYTPAADTLETKTTLQSKENMKKKTKISKSAGKGGRLSPTTSRAVLDSRPPWVAPALKPKDLDKSFRAFMSEVDPNDPKLPKSALVYHNKWGIVKSQHEEAMTKSLDFELGLGSKHRKDGHRILTTKEDFDLKKTAQRKSLSEVMELENLSERRKAELVEAPWNPPIAANKTIMQWFNSMPGVAGYEAYPISTEMMTLSRTMPTTGQEEMDHPRVIFISSRVHAADLLDDAVLFGVIPIVYEYEGTTSQALLMKLEKALAGRRARSVGLFCHSEEPGELRLAHGCTVNMKTLDRADVREFFEKICRRHIIPADKGGQFDIFVPLAASGLEIVVQNSIRTGIQFSSPTGIIGNYNCVNSEWLIPYKDEKTRSRVEPPSMYFCQSKLDVWSHVADQAREALSSCKTHLQHFFQKTHRDIVSQLAGEVVFDVLGQTEIVGANKVTAALTEGLQELGSQDNVNPLEFLGQYLLEKSGVQDLNFTSSQDQMMRREDYTDEDEEVENINGHGDKDKTQEQRPDFNMSGK